MPIPKQLLNHANSGKAQAQLELGRLHAEGRGVPYDLEEGLAWFEKAADRDLPEAVLEVALAHEYGLGTDRNYEAAFSAYMRAARLYQQPLPFTIRGLVLTQNLCLDKHRGQLALAEAGYAHACWSFVYGPKRKGNPPIKVKHGKSWLKRQAKIRKWTRRAAMLGYPPAFIDMTCVINRGEGEPGDAAKLLGWYLKACRHDESVAKMIADKHGPAELFAGIQGAEAAEAASDLAAWNQIWMARSQERRETRAVSRPSEGAKSQGDMFFGGKDGRAPDYSQSRRWYLRAAKLGCQWSMGQLAKIYLNGLGEVRDAANGFAWLDRQFSVTFCNGTKIVDQRMIFHWALRPIVEGHLDHLDEDQLFAWLQVRTHAFEPACAALSGGYDLTRSSVAANHVCKAFRPDVFVKERLDESTRKIVGIRVNRITRLLARQEAAMIARAEAGDAPSQFWYAASFKRYKNRSGMALRWLLKSAEQGYSPAQYEAAKAYADGDGAPVSVDEARRWFKAASLSGHTWAQREYVSVLSGTYEWGDYPKAPQRIASKDDLFEAYAWLIATQERAGTAEDWLRYSPEQVLAAYRRADEIRREMVAYDHGQSGTTTGVDG